MITVCSLLTLQLLFASDNAVTRCLYSFKNVEEYTFERPATPLPKTHTELPQFTAETGYLYGTSLGGWLVMEINPVQRTLQSGLDVRPQWMFDQLSASSELDFVSGLREAVSDGYAIHTMRNHWSGYLPDDVLDAMAGLGINAVRIPVGYWIVDAPVGGSSPLEYGFNPEGFVTGGLNHLSQMLYKLKARGVVALLDMHALPCNSACVSDGMNCAAPLAYDDKAPIGDIKRCDGQVYPTLRRREGHWRDVSVEAVSKLAAWVRDLPDDLAGVVVAVQLANEPALNSGGFDAMIKEFYTEALHAARENLPSLPLVLSFIPPNDYAVPAFLNSLMAGGGGQLLADHHWYLNWAGPEGVILSWADLHRRACHEAAASWSVYSAASVKLLIGEWSLAANHDAPLDITDPQIISELRQLFREQLEVYTSDPNVIGSFYWTLRMGSGWDPRPTEESPGGQQVHGSSAYRSFASYPFRVWSLLEMQAAGVALPLNSSFEGTCSFVPP